MRYNSRAEVENIGMAGAYCEEMEDSYRCRAMSSFWIRCEKDDTAFTPHLQTQGYWESWVLLWLSNNLKPRQTFYDVGANVGFYSLWAAFHNCRVVAYEPNLRVSGLIRRSIRDNGFTELAVEEIALSDRNQRSVPLWIPNGHSGAASLYKGSVPGDIVNVPTWRFDEIAMIDRPSIMKIDAEGSEPQIWAGLQEGFATGDLTIVLEWQRDRYDAEVFADSLLSVAEPSLIDYDGNEITLNKQNLLRIKDLQMIVARAK